MRLVYINFLWAFFTLCGGIIFGAFPATMAMFTVIRSFQHTNDGLISTFNLFFKSFKSAFLKSNLLNVIFMSVISISLANIVFFSQLISGPFQVISLSGSILSLTLCSIALIVIFPIYVTFDLTLKESLMMAIFLPFTRLPITLFFFVTIIGLGAFFYLMPAFIFFFGISGPAYCFHLLSNKLFKALPT
ncbi:DUF624 domain-containing protein [Bacillus sp. A301a_S52]|nr:DUF624 domain-containing protein [Bacillus sp. A301a_S52]